MAEIVATTSLPVDRLMATDCNAAARAKPQNPQFLRFWSLRWKSVHKTALAGSFLSIHSIKKSVHKTAKVRSFFHTKMCPQNCQGPQFYRHF